MRRNDWIFGIMAVVLSVGGCGNAQEQAGEHGSAAEQKLQEYYISGEQNEAVPMVEVVYSEDEDYRALADFLIEYYQIPDEYWSETRYYYNYTDLNEDGEQEIFAVVIGEYTRQPSGDPALILSIGEGDTFEVIESFASLQTPVTVSEVITNGWHELIYYGHGRNERDGYRICRYNSNGGYQTELSEITDEIGPLGGKRILSDNLIDDMDKGDYLTLAPDATAGER